MRQSRFTDSQILAISKQKEEGGSAQGDGEDCVCALWHQHSVCLSVS